MSLFVWNMLKYRARAKYQDGRKTSLSGKEAYAIYAKATNEILPEYGGKLTFVGEVTYLRMGGVGAKLKMEKKVKFNEIRAFVPSKDYEISKSFYVALGFNGESVGEELTLFTKDGCTFFLQKYYNEEFANNVMLQLIVSDINESYELISEINIENARHSEIRQEPWGKVIYLWGPSGELWHVTELPG